MKLILFGLFSLIFVNSVQAETRDQCWNKYQELKKEYSKHSKKIDCSKILSDMEDNSCYTPLEKYCPKFIVVRRYVSQTPPESSVTSDPAQSQSLTLGTVNPGSLMPYQLALQNHPQTTESLARVTPLAVELTKVPFKLWGKSPRTRCSGYNGANSWEADGKPETLALCQEKTRILKEKIKRARKPQEIPSIVTCTESLILDESNVHTCIHCGQCPRSMNVHLVGDDGHPFIGLIEPNTSDLGSACSVGDTMKLCYISPEQMHAALEHARTKAKKSSIPVANNLQAENDVIPAVHGGKDEQDKKKGNRRGSSSGDSDPYMRNLFTALAVLLVVGLVMYFSFFAFGEEKQSSSDKEVEKKPKRRGDKKKMKHNPSPVEGGFINPQQLMSHPNPTPAPFLSSPYDQDDNERRLHELYQQQKGGSTHRMY